MTYTYTIPGRLPGLNDLLKVRWGAETTRFWNHRIKKKATSQCAQWAVAGLVPKFTKPIVLEINWIEPNRRRDVDNIRTGAKFILDGLVQAGKIPNDTQAWVARITDEFNVDPKTPRVVVKIREADGEPVPQA